MGLVSGCVIVTRDSSPAVEALNGAMAAWAAENGRGAQLFARLDPHGCGGRKALQFELWAAGFNYVDPRVVERMVVAAPWRYPDETTVVIDAQEYGEEQLRQGTVESLRARPIDWHCSRIEELTVRRDDAER